MRTIIGLMLVVAACSNQGSTKGNEIIDLNGIVIYRFDKANGFYWLKGTWFYSNDRKIQCQIITDIFGYEKNNKLCNANIKINTRDIRRKWGTKTSFYNSSNYRNQEINEQNPTHYGGDIYFDKDLNIVIAFRMTGQGILFKDTCSGFIDDFNDKNSSIPCEYPLTNLQIPFIQLLYFDSTFTIDSKDLSIFSLRKSQLDRFTVLYCE